MNDRISFFVKLPGTPEQAIVVMAGETSTNILPIPELVLPEDPTERFWVIHSHLVANNVLPDIDTQYVPAQ